jgi:hypothetical protein
MKGEKEDNNFFEDIKGRGKFFFKEFNYFYEVNRTSGNKKQACINTKIKLLVTKEGIEKKQGIW